MTKINLISEEKLAELDPRQKIQLILDELQAGCVLILERGLTPSEQRMLLERIMARIDPDFPGIELESYPYKISRGLLEKLKGQVKITPRLTLIAPAGKLKVLSKSKHTISLSL